MHDDSTSTNDSIATSHDLADNIIMVDTDSKFESVAGDARFCSADAVKQICSVKWKWLLQLEEVDVAATDMLCALNDFKTDHDNQWELLIGNISSVLFKLVNCQQIDDDTHHFYFANGNCYGSTWWMSLFCLISSI